MKGTLDATFIAAETTHAAVLFADMRGYVALAASRAMLQSFAPVAIDWRNEFEVVTGIGLHLGEVALR
jgi:class 3 adenylate cyclase